MNTSIGSQLIDIASGLKTKIALKNLSGKKITYENLAMMLEVSASFFKESGLGKRTRIAVVSKSGLDLGLLFFLVSESCIFIPLDHEFSKVEFEKRYDLLDTDILMVEKDYQGPALTGWKGENVIRYSLHDCSIQFEIEALSDKSDIAAMPDSEIALVLTTSGTTSTPKVVPLTGENLLVAAQEKLNVFGFSEADTNLILTPLFKGTSINSMITTLLSGGTVLITDGFKLVALMTAIQENSVTWFTASPAVLNSIAGYAIKENLRMAGHSLRFVRSSGAPLNKATKDHLEMTFGVPVIQTYGMTETRTIASTYGLSQFKEGSVGVSLGTDIKIENGEILVHGKNVFAGYENNQAANAASFSEGWFRTGDLGYVDEDGFLFITGRAKEMINRGGEKISPYEVEAAILKLDHVTDAAVFPYPNRYGSDDAGAVLVLESGAAMSLSELRNQLLGNLSPFKMPSLLYVVDEIPLSNSGKVQRSRLFEQLDSLEPRVYARKHMPSEAEVNKPDLSNTENELCRIWKEILNVESVGLSDNFFDLGGDSLAAAELFLDIEKTFGIQVTIDDLFNVNTIRDLAGLVDAGSKSHYEFLVKIKEGSAGLPLFFVHSGDGEVVTYHGVSNLMRKDRRLWGIKFSRDAEWKYPIDFDQLAERYIQEIKAIQPQGPYRIIGNCHGGVLAYHLACRLTDRGDKVSLLAMFDPLMGNQSSGSGSFGMRKRIWYAFVDIRERDLHDLPAIIAKKAVSFFRVLKFKVQYRIYSQVCKSGDKRKLRWVSSLIILKKAKEITSLDKFDGKVHYFVPSKTAKGSAYSIAYWKGMAKELEVVEFEGTHNYMTSNSAPSLAMKIEETLEKVDD